jgi:hypothetical protein
LAAFRNVASPGFARIVDWNAVFNDYRKGLPFPLTGKCAGVKRRQRRRLSNATGRLLLLFEDLGIAYRLPLGVDASDPLSSRFAILRYRVADRHFAAAIRLDVRPIVVVVNLFGYDFAGTGNRRLLRVFSSIPFIAVRCFELFAFGIHAGVLNDDPLTRLNVNLGQTFRSRTGAEH